MSATESTQAVHSYLTVEFPENEVCIKSTNDGPSGLEFKLKATVFRIDTGTTTSLLYAGREFLRDHSPTEIKGLLRHWRIAEMLRQSDGIRIFVGSNGPQQVDV